MFGIRETLASVRHATDEAALTAAESRQQLARIAEMTELTAVAALVLASIAVGALVGTLLRQYTR